jgi:pimeloyl-ACP methyl ester carboxylesterase
MLVMGIESIGRRAEIHPASPRLCSTADRVPGRAFDPSVYRIVLFDQRGSGRSVAHANEPNIDLCTNTTAHLLADI